MATTGPEKVYSIPKHFFLHFIHNLIPEYMYKDFKDKDGVELPMTKEQILAKWESFGLFARNQGLSPDSSL